MGAADLDTVYAVSGRLAKACTNLATAWPHGGTGLGLVGEVSVLPQRAARLLIYEEFNAPGGVIRAGGPVELRCRTRNWDADAIASLFRGGSTSSGQPLLSWSPGVALATPLTNVVFTPDAASLGDPPPTLALFNVVAVPEDEGAFAYSAYRWLSIRLRLIATTSGTDLGRMGAPGSVGV